MTLNPPDSLISFAAPLIRCDGEWQSENADDVFDHLVGRID
jgi:hypothetical protein